MKHVKLILFLVCLASYANAQSVILYNHSDEIASFPFARIQSISFNNKHLNLSLLSKEFYSISLNEVNKIVFQHTDSTMVGGKINHVTNRNSRLYPNPAINILNIELPNNLQSKEIHIVATNIDGRKIFEKRLTYFNNSIQINISDWISGIYVIHIYNGENSYSNKLIKR